MRYVVAYTDVISGKTIFKPFDYINDAEEFAKICKEESGFARLYIELQLKG